MLLLADVFETFQNSCLRQYGLDPAHYYTSPGLSQEFLLKKTGVELKLLTGYNQHLFIEKGIRGGLKHYVKAYNPLEEGNDQEKQPILYLDANNLCGLVLSQSLPTCSFQWVKKNCEVQVAPLLQIGWWTARRVIS